MTPFNLAPKTIGLSRTVSEINGDLCRKSPLSHPRVFVVPVERVILGKGYRSAQGSEETRVMGLPDG